MIKKQNIGVPQIAVIMLILFMLYAAYKENTPVLSSVAEARVIAKEISGKEETIPVIIFSAEYCSTCRHLEKTLTKSGVSFIKADVEKNMVARKYFTQFTANRSGGIPQTLVGTSLLRGYVPEEILKEIKLLKNMVN